MTPDTLRFPFQNAVLPVAQRVEDLLSRLTLGDNAGLMFYDVLPLASGTGILRDGLTGHAAPKGKLPFDLPRSMAAVEGSREDVPFDTENPVFRCGHGHSMAVADASLTATSGATR